MDERICKWWVYRRYIGNVLLKNIYLRKKCLYLMEDMILEVLNYREEDW